MQKTVLVTGASGFVGPIVQQQWSNIVLWPRSADLTDRALVRSKVNELLEKHQFTAVLHLAAQSNPRLSFSKVVETWSTNVMGTLHLTGALEERGWNGRFLFTSTGEVYGEKKGEIDESTPVQPLSPYVSSKCAAEQVVRDFHTRSAAQAMVVRSFNHSGPGQKRLYFLPSMAFQIARLPATGGTIDVGNLNVQKNFLHVRDVVRAYAALLESGQGGETYNLGARESRSLEEILRLMAEMSGKPVEYRTHPDRFREESPEPVSVCTNKLQEHTGWRREESLESLLGDLLSYWSDQIKTAP